MNPEVVSDSEGVNISELPTGAWLMRPCEWYHEEYKNCNGLKGKFHSYFIHGEMKDCSQWLDDYRSCIQWRKRKNIDALEKVIASETKRADDRKLSSEQNNVWKLRESPPDPEEWNKPLPEWMAKRQANSLFANSNSYESKSCVIS